MKHLSAITLAKAQTVVSPEVMDFVAKLDALAATTLPHISVDIRIFGGKNGA